jgi:large subunit ribosomal protein L10
MLTKTQKKSQVILSVDDIKKSQSLVFADFTGVSTPEVRTLKLALKVMGAKFKVYKKSLLKIALKQSGVVVDADKFESQLGTVFAPKGIYDVAGTVAKFAKDLLRNSKKEFKILGAYDSQEKRFVDSAQFALIAKLPPREILLAQIAMMLTMPIKKVMVGLNSRKEQLEKTV